MASHLPQLYADITTALENASGLHDDGSGSARLRRIESSGSQDGANHRRFTFVVPTAGSFPMSHGAGLLRASSKHRLRVFHAKQNRPDRVFALDVYQDVVVIARTIFAMADGLPTQIEGAPLSIEWTHDERTGATDIRFGVLALEPA